MRIVAGDAVGICHRVIHVRSSKSELFSFMALFAKGRHILFQQKFCFGRSMRVVAVETTAAPIKRSVPESEITNLFAQILMAVKTYFIA
jgi:hypothetical protein